MSKISSFFVIIFSKSAILRIHKASAFLYKNVIQKEAEKTSLAVNLVLKDRWEPVILSKLHRYPVIFCSYSEKMSNK